MIISNTHQTINALKKIVPGGLVFVLDTTDRSFVYKCSDKPMYEEQVMSLDRIHGIDVLTKFNDFYTHEGEKSIVKLKRIGQNTFMGLCASRHKLSADQMDFADNYLSQIN